MVLKQSLRKGTKLLSKKLKKLKFDKKLIFLDNINDYIGVSPSGKAAGFGPAIRRFESFHPSFL